MHLTRVLLDLAVMIILTACIAGASPMSTPRNEPSEDKEHLVMRNASMTMPLITLEKIQSSGKGGHLPIPIAGVTPLFEQLLPRDREPYGGAGYLAMTFCSTGGESTCKLFFLLLNAGCYADPLLDLPNLKTICWNERNFWSWYI